MLVDGHFKSEPFQAETDYLAQALAPAEGSPGQPGMIRAEVVTESRTGPPRAGQTTTSWSSATSAQFTQAEVTDWKTFSTRGGAW